MKIKKSLQFFTIFLIFATGVIILNNGCGKSILGKPVLPPSDLAKNAIDKGDYNEAINNSNTVINDPNATASDKSEAYVIRGEANLGSALASAGSSTGTMVTDIKNAVSSTDGINAIMKAIPTKVLNSTDEAAKITQSAKDLNAASQSGSLDASAQSARMLANSVAAVSKVNSVFDINNDGQVTDAELGTLSTNEVTAKWQQINPTTGTSTQESVTTLINNANQAGEVVFSNDPTTLDSIKQSNQNIDIVNSKILAGGISGAELAQYLLKKK